MLHGDRSRHSPDECTRCGLQLPVVLYGCDAPNVHSLVIAGFRSCSAAVSLRSQGTVSDVAGLSPTGKQASPRG